VNARLLSQVPRESNGQRTSIHPGASPPALTDPAWSPSSTRHRKTTVAALPALMLYPLPARFSHRDVTRLASGTQLTAS